MGVADLVSAPELRELRASYRAFIDEHILPAESALFREDDAAQELLAELRSRAKAEGLWAPHLPPEVGGTGRGFLTYAHLNEEIGRVTWAQYVFNCQAPDAGNGEILDLFGTEEQKERWLRPLVAGEARSFFSMTEPDVSGADPTGLRTTAVLDGDEWVINGRKWFSSGAEGALFGIVMAVTEPDAEVDQAKHHLEQCSWCAKRYHFEESLRQYVRIAGEEPISAELQAKLAGLQKPRGWGLFLIKKMVDDVRVTSDERHHTVELVMRLGGGNDGRDS